MLDVDEHVGQPVLDRLERADRPAELHPGLRVLDRQVQQMLCGPDLFDGQQRRAHLQGVGDDAVGLVGAGHQPAPGASVNRMVACGRVRSMVASGVRSTPGPAASTA